MGPLVISLAHRARVRAAGHRGAGRPVAAIWQGKLIVQVLFWYKSGPFISELVQVFNAVQESFACKNNTNVIFAVLSSDLQILSYRISNFPHSGQKLDFIKTIIDKNIH